MSDRDDATTRDNIARVAKGFLETARKAGNSELTYDQARERVERARRRGDLNRENNNR